VIGPEGGVADDEIALARERGAVTVSLGARNLRSETAAIAAVVLVMDRLP
jgi:16S rRNA (uracil1498-N3)-methyltransferase